MLLVVGRIVRPHGVRGEVVVDVRTDEPERAFRGRVGARRPTRRGGPARARRIDATVAARTQGRLLVRFEEYADRDAAEALRGVLLRGRQRRPRRAATTRTSSTTTSWSGWPRSTPAGEPLGEVIRVEHAPGADLLVLRLPGRAHALVPFVKAIVPRSTWPAAGSCSTRPSGLLDL